MEASSLREKSVVKSPPRSLLELDVYIWREFSNVDIRRGAWNNAEVRRWAAAGPKAVARELNEGLIVRLVKLVARFLMNRANN